MKSFGQATACFESFVKLFAAGVPQIEIEAQIVEVTETDSLDYGIRPFADSPTYERTTGDPLIDSFTVDFPNTVDSPESLLALSTIQDDFTNAGTISLEAVGSTARFVIDGDVVLDGGGFIAKRRIT